MESFPRPREWPQTSTEQTLHARDGRAQPVDRLCVKQEPHDQADLGGQDKPLASWRRQPVPGPPRPSQPFASSGSLQNSGHDIQLKDGNSSSPASEGDGEADNGEMTPQTAAEKRAEKRKMKRFRLTHNQTRFLMSEYARQAHPDAAQRERLSREIPGLSPRQVQVWFQNRRAKLKRLTADDQESMLKSRALPLGFDTTQALHYMHDTPSQVDVTGPSSFFQHNHNGHGMRRSSAIGINTEVEMISPVSASTSFGELYSTPGSLTSGIFSPTSPSSELPPFFTSSFSQGTSPRTQVQNVRPRAGSASIVPMDTAMTYMVDPATPGRFQSSGMNPQQQFNSYAWLNYLRRPTLPSFPVKYGEPQDSLQHRVAGYYPYSRGNLMDPTAYARRASDSVLVGGQSVAPVIMPVRPTQSAPLAAPPDFLTAQQSSQKQFSEAGPRGGFVYEQDPQNSNFWGSSTMFSNQAEYTGQFSNLSNLDLPPDGDHDEGGEQETFEGWNG
ncbi:MAG: hypothetical protein Q9216_003521 [Gyalolechia sp. 2 TL-2023]